MALGLIVAFCCTQAQSEYINVQTFKNAPGFNLRPGSEQRPLVQEFSERAETSGTPDTRLPETRQQGFVASARGSLGPYRRERLTDYRSRIARYQSRKKIRRAIREYEMLYGRPAEGYGEVANPMLVGMPVGRGKGKKGRGKRGKGKKGRGKGKKGRGKGKPAHGGKGGGPLREITRDDRHLKMTNFKLTRQLRELEARCHNGGGYGPHPGYPPPPPYGERGISNRGYPPPPPYGEQGAEGGYPPPPPYGEQGAEGGYPPPPPPPYGEQGAEGYPPPPPYGATPPAERQAEEADQTVRHAEQRAEVLDRQAGKADDQSGYPVPSAAGAAPEGGTPALPPGGDETAPAGDGAAAAAPEGGTPAPPPGGDGAGDGAAPPPAGDGAAAAPAGDGAAPAGDGAAPAGDGAAPGAEEQTELPSGPGNTHKFGRQRFPPRVKTRFIRKTAYRTPQHRRV